jgi:hypothetical protein
MTEACQIDSARMIRLTDKAAQDKDVQERVGKVLNVREYSFAGYRMGCACFLTLHL